MDEHLIRFRRGWEPSGAGPEVLPRPFTLPRADFPPASGSVIGIARWFRSPPIDPACETLWLRLDAVPGLISVALNGVEIACGEFHDPPVTIALSGGLAARNQLVLNVQPLPAGRAMPLGFLWGEIALVVRREGPA